jgi:tetratricopeptide (TPR) repeat protein
MACLSDDRRARGALQRAAMHLQSGELAEADSICRELHESWPEDGKLVELWGLVALQAGEHERAIGRLRQAAQARPASAALWSNLAAALRRAGQLGPALECLRQALELDPQSADVLYNLAAAERASGNVAAAVRAYGRALELRPGFVEAMNNLGLALLDWARPAEAVLMLEQARAQAPLLAAVHGNLGKALCQAARLPEAVASYRRAVELDPACVAAWFNLHGLLYDQGDLAGAARALERVLDSAPSHPNALFLLGVTRAQQGDGSGAASCFASLRALDPVPEHLLDSWDYVRAARGPRTRLFAYGHATLAHALAEAALPGLVLELGVRFGASLRFIAQHAGQPVHGFDSFRGLPEAWGPHPVGMYSTDGELPELPPHVELHVGDFAHTLPAFLGREPGPLRFANVDCDLCSSTRTALQQLASRITRGSVLVFDEYLANPGWREGEFAAFQQAVAERGWRYEYLAFSLFSKQAAVRITSVA